MPYAQYLLERDTVVGSRQSAVGIMLSVLVWIYFIFICHSVLGILLSAGVIVVVNRNARTIQFDELYSSFDFETNDE